MIPFAFDWRRPIEDEARRLGDAVEAALARARDERAAGAPARPFDGRPARAHDAARVSRDVWTAHDGARRRAPADARHAQRRLVGADAGAVGRRHLRQRAGRVRRAVSTTRRRAQADGAAARASSSCRPACSTRRSASTATRHLAEARRRRPGARCASAAAGTTSTCSSASTRGACRRRRVLDQAVALRKRLDAQIAQAPAGFTRQDAAGRRPRRFTPAGYRDRRRGPGLPRCARHGDGRVTLPSALLPGVRTWKVDCEHGDLPEVKDGFRRLSRAARDRRRRTQLDAAVGTRRGAACARPRAVAHRAQPPARATAPAPCRRTTRARSCAPGARRRSRRGRAARHGAAHHASVNGDLNFVHQPLLLGHYRSLRADRHRGVDRPARRRSDEATRSRPACIRTRSARTRSSSTAARRRTIRWQMPRPHAVVVVGLGEEGKLRGDDLVLDGAPGDDRLGAARCGEAATRRSSSSWRRR